jgi:hypothetical protein
LFVAILATVLSHFSVNRFHLEAANFPRAKLSKNIRVFKTLITSKLLYEQPLLLVKAGARGQACTQASATIISKGSNCHYYLQALAFMCSSCTNYY